MASEHESRRALGDGWCILQAVAGQDETVRRGNGSRLVPGEGAIHNHDAACPSAEVAALLPRLDWAETLVP